MTQPHKQPHIKETRQQLIDSLLELLKDLEKSSEGEKKTILKAALNTLNAYISTLPPSYK